jgi:hypothetical protein
MLDKAIYYGKEYRKPYYRSGNFDRSCRNHGDCGWCMKNRIFFDYKRRKFAEDDLKEYYYL